MKYPFEIASSVRKSKTFAVDAKFTKDLSEKPLQVFDDTFSRYVLTIISDGDAITCNVPVDMIAYMEAATNHAFNRHMDGTNKSAAGSSPAFTERFVTGNLKGKTPADVLTENGENGKKMLNDQYKWLQSNLEKFPANKKLMDAIVDASKIDISTLQNEATSSAPIDILEIGTRPLIRKTRDDGMCFCYEGKITWTPGNKYPVSITIKNYYAPVVKNEDKTLNVNLKGKDRNTEKVYDFNMSAQEWMHTMAQIKMTHDAFVMTNFAKAMQTAVEADEEARKGVHQVA